MWDLRPGIKPMSPVLAGGFFTTESPEGPRFAAWVSQVVESKCNGRDPGNLILICGPGRSPGGGNGNPLWYSCLGSGQEEPGRLQSMELQRVRHNWVTEHTCSTKTALATFPGGTSAKDPTWQCGRCKRLGFDPWVGMIPWRAQQPTAIFLPGESHGQRSLAGYSLWGRKESDTTEVP